MIDYFTIFLTFQTECGLELPKWWDKVWPEKITEMAIRQYSIAYTKSEMKKLCCGLFFNKIIEDTMKKIKEPRGNEFEKKMYLYSVHDSNMAMLLFALGAFDNCIPKYGSYISFEVHKINDTFGFKVSICNMYCHDIIYMHFRSIIRIMKNQNQFLLFYLIAKSFVL